MRIGIVGLGYVGLPLAVAFCEAGQEVVGVDTDARVVDALSRGESHVDDVPAESLDAGGARFKASTRYPDLDLERLVGESTLLVDFRGVTRAIEAPSLVRL
jgi:UDP-N-acetyl-D-glucosamine dehydrogenase